jgi:hypothetical protein
MTGKQGRWIEDSSASGKIYHWMLWSTAQEERKDRLDEAREKRVKLT